MKNYHRLMLGKKRAFAQWRFAGNFVGDPGHRFLPLSGELQSTEGLR